MDDSQILEIWKQAKHRETTGRGAAFLNRMVEAKRPSSEINYALSRLQTAQQPEDVDSITKELEQEFGGLKDPNFFADPTSIPAAIGAGGLFKAGAMTLKPLANRVPTIPIKGISKVQGLAGKALNAVANQPLKQAAAEMVGFEAGAGVVRGALSDEWQEQNPLKTLGAEMLVGGAGVGAVNKLRAEAIGNLAKDVAAPLTNETGAVVPNPIRGVADRASSLWKSTAGEKIQAGIDYLTRLPLLPKDSRVARYMQGNTLQDIFVHPMDRKTMPENAGKAFINTVTEQQRVANSLSDVSEKVLGLNLTQKEDLYKILRGNFDINAARPENRDLLTGILQPFQDSITQSKKKLLPKAKHEELYERRMEDQLLKLFAEDVQNPVWTTLRDSYKGDLATPKGTQEFLKAILDNPLLRDSPVYRLAYDLHDLPARTASEVATKVKGAFETVLFNKVKSNPQWVMDSNSLMKKVMNELGVRGQATMENILKLPPDKLPQARKMLDQYVHLSGYKDFEGMLVHKDVADAIKDLDTSQSAARRIWNTYYLNPWKAMKTILNPAARIRDPLTQVLFNDVAGAHPLSPWSGVYIDAIKEMKNGGQAFKDFAYYTGGDVGSWANVEIRPLINAFKYGAGMLEVPYKFLYDNRATKAAYDFTQMADTWTKLAKYMHNVKMGMPKNDAAIDAMRVGGNHMLQSRGTKVLRDTLMPFFGWQVHAIKTMGKGFVQHPVRTAKYFAIPAVMGQQAIESLGMNEDDWNQFKTALPEFVKDEVLGMPTHIPLPVRDENGRIQMMDIGWWLPGLQDMAELGRNMSTPVGLMQNPALSTYAALKDNKKFSGAPIYHEWEDPSTKAQKMLSYVLQQHLPNWAPGVGTAWQKMSDAFDEDNIDPNKMTPQQAVGANFGAKVTPFDEQNTIAKNQARLENWMNEAQRMMTKELSKTRSPEEQRAIMDDYASIYEAITKEMQGGKE